MTYTVPRRRRASSGTLVVLAFAWLAPAALAHAAPEYDPWRGRSAAPATDRVIVKLRPQPADRAQAQAAGDRVAALAQRTGIALRGARNVYDDVYVARLDGIVTEATVAESVRQLRADAAVASAEPDLRMRAHAAPNDALFSGTPGVAGRTGQWYMQAIAATPVGATTAATNAVSAWDTTTGTESVIVAVLDTGVRFDHPDLLRVANGGKLLDGWDFVSADSGGGTLTANDGDGWDPDPSDPGDWITPADTSNTQFADCEVDDSSWHGTRVSGIVGALSNNGVGVAGFGWRTRILPVRVLGKCGGYLSDIAAAMRWAAGLPVTGVPDNPTPARILNLSLGGTAQGCANEYQATIDAVVARGTLVVVSAGNEGGILDQPASCRGVVAVTAVRHAGTKVGFANLGPGTSIAAPGGNCVNTGAGQPCLFSIDTTTNAGATGPAANIYTDQQNFNVGTSFSAPIVSGIASLLYAVHGSLTPAQANARLEAGARPFPTLATDETGTAVPHCRVPRGPADVQDSQCNCSKWTCGVGMVDAGRTIGAVQSPIAGFTYPEVGGAGVTVQLDGTASSPGAGAALATYAWSITTGTGTLSAPNAATTSLQLPMNSEVAVQLAVTDTRGGSHATTRKLLSRVPTLRGLTEAAAVTALADADLALGFIDRVASSSSPPGTVFNHSEIAGEIVRSGMPIILYVATGTVNVAVPDVTGQTQASATTALQNAQLALGTVTTQASATVPNGSVISQTPVAGTNVPPGTTVSLVVSSGSPPAAAGGGGGGGGGSLDLGTLALCALAALYARKRRRGPVAG